MSYSSRSYRRTGPNPALDLPVPTMDPWIEAVQDFVVEVFQAPEDMKCTCTICQEIDDRPLTGIHFCFFYRDKTNTGQTVGVWEEDPFRNWCIQVMNHCNALQSTERFYDHPVARVPHDTAWKYWKTFRERHGAPAFPAMHIW